MKRLALFVLLTLPLACGPLDDTVGSTTGASTSCTSTETWASYGQGFMAANCTRCHGQYASQSTVQASKNAISTEISLGRMPQGFALSSTERSRVIAWLACGAP